MRDSRCKVPACVVVDWGKAAGGACTRGTMARECMAAFWPAVMGCFMDCIQMQRDTLFLARALSKSEPCTKFRFSMGWENFNFSPVWAARAVGDDDVQEQEGDMGA